MTTPLLPPNPCLVAVLLVVQSRSGPRFVFHYPSDAPQNNGLNGGASGSTTRKRRSPGSRTVDDSSSSSAGDDTDASNFDYEDILTPPPPSSSKPFGVSANAGVAATVAADNQSDNASSGRRVLKKTEDPGEDEDDEDAHGGMLRSGGVGVGGGSSVGGAGSVGGVGGVGAGGGGTAGGRRGSGKTDEPNKPAWETVLGFDSAGLGRMLCPPREYHKRRFELMMGPLVFLGRPIFVREDGTWKRRGRKSKSNADATAAEKKEKNDGNGTTSGTPECENPPEVALESRDSSGNEGENENAQAKDDNENDDDNDDDGKNDDKSTKNDSAAVSDGGSSEHAERDREKGKEKDANSMTMFHVVFVLDPPMLEYTTRVKEMYHHVVKKFCRGLIWEQVKSDYVWREVKNILAIKEAAKEAKTPIDTLYNNLLAGSMLARAIASVYASISTSRIASAVLTEALCLSLQIPLQTSIRSLPPPTSPQLPGIWLTTAEPSLPEDDPYSAPHSLPSKSFTLLLLDSKSAILRDLSPVSSMYYSSASAAAAAAAAASSSPATDDQTPFIIAMTKYIAHTTPTKSFAQIAAASTLDLATIQYLAAHLIYWRRARAIPPLHQRDTYIVSPNADLSALPDAVIAYHRRFPTLPSLPKMLNLLSGTPKPYKTFFPSKDHKDVYLEILAWLMRGGWVTQLRTFGWVVVSGEIQAEVESAMRAEKMEKQKQQQKQEAEAKENASEEVQGSSATANAEAESAEPHRPSTRSSSSTNTVKAVPTCETHAGGDADANADADADGDDHREISSYSTKLLSSPHRADSLESRWLQAIGSHFANEDTRRYWPMFVKYFNGSDALEKIAVREGLKRKLVWQLLSDMNAQGGLVVGRHW